MSCAQPSSFGSTRSPKSESQQGPQTQLTDTTNEFTNNNNVDALGDLGLQRRVLEQTLGCKVRGADVGVETERLAQTEDTLFWANGSNSPLGSTDST